MTHSEQRRGPHPIALILRIYLDDAGIMRGRVDDPASETRTPFAGPDELIALIATLAVQNNPPGRSEQCDD